MPALACSSPVRKSGRYARTGASSSTSPSSTSCITSVAVQTLVIDWIMNTASGVVSTPVRRFTTPAEASTVCRSTSTATDAPGTSCAATRRGSSACSRRRTSSVRVIRASL